MRIPLSFAILISMAGAASAQGSSKVLMPLQGDGTPQSTNRAGNQQALDKLQALPRPTEQGDLNTSQLASAHREQAASMQEKTNGLWQSWLVSVCEGCGSDRRPFTDRDGDEYLKRLRAKQASGTTEKPKYIYYYPAGGEQKAKPSNIAVNLSNESIDQIRRDPNR